VRVNSAAGAARDGGAADHEARRCTHAHRPYAGGAGWVRFPTLKDSKFAREMQMRAWTCPALVCVPRYTHSLCMPCSLRALELFSLHTTRTCRTNATVDAALPWPAAYIRLSRTHPLLSPTASQVYGCFPSTSDTLSPALGVGGNGCAFQATLSLHGVPAVRPVRRRALASSLDIPTRSQDIQLGRGASAGEQSRDIYLGG
jgi:hypothetical protein